jgi:peptide/nickel transport system substrate-binding protein
MKRVWHLSAAVLLLCGAITLSYGGAALADQDSGFLTIVLQGDIITLDPVHMLDTQSSHVGEQMYENLLANDRYGIESPSLATSWEASEDWSTVTFYLRQGVTFHDGTEFDAYAVKFNFDRVLDAEVASYNRENLLNGIAAVEVIDKYTVRFTTTGYQAGWFKKYVMTDDTLIISPASVEEFGYTDTGINGAGTGPWRYEEYKEAQYVKLVRYDEYWGGAPILEGLIFRPIPELQAAVIELQTGGVDFMMSLSSESLPALEADPSIIIAKEPDGSVRGLFFQQDAFPPFQDVRVRTALLMALDRHEIVEAFLEGVAVPIDTIIPIRSWGYDPNVATWPYDPAAAKQLLEDAGWVDTDGDGIREKDGQELAWTITTPDHRYLSDVEISEAAAHAWGEVGCKVSVEVLEWGAFLDKTVSPDVKTHHMMFIGSLNVSLDPILYVRHAYSKDRGISWHGYHNPTLDALYEKAQTEHNQDIRAGLYYAISQLLFEDPLWVPLFNALGMAAHTSSLKGFTYSPYQYNDYTRCYFEGG